MNGCPPKNSEFFPKKSSALVMISAGESSGEMHGAALIQAAHKKNPDWRFLGLGGDRMAAAGAELLAHINDTAVMGITEVIGSLRRILAISKIMKRALNERRPDALVLIDFPDFNFGLAKAAHKLGIPVIYYICPQVWAWRAGRLKFLARYTSRRALLFAFEKEFYKARQVEADWVGHPILDNLDTASSPARLKEIFGFSPSQKLLAIMPGSRKAVVSRLAPVFFKAAELLLDKVPGLELVLPRADSITEAFLQPLINEAGPVVKQRLRIIPGASRELLAASDAAILASGTSSVEATFLETPMAVAYQVSSFSWLMAKLLVSVPYISIANLVAGKEVVPEFLQDKATPGNLAAAVFPVLSDDSAKAAMKAELATVKAKLGTPGASLRVADIIAEEIGKRRRI